jgi:hypothetical protein
MTPTDLFIIFGPLCAFAILLGIAFEIARIKGVQ